MTDIKTTTGSGKALVPPAISVLAPAFAHDPVIAYMLNNLTPGARLAYLPAYFRALLTAAALNGAAISEADGWRSCAVVMPPGADVGNAWTLVPAGIVGLLWTLGVGGCRKMMGEYAGVTGGAKERAMGRGGRYYYVFFVGTAEEGRGRGLASRLMEEVQEVAGREGMPVWLEATTERSRRVYARLGFEDLGEIVLGKGQVGADGEPKKGGEGVRIWPMIWRPDSAKSDCENMES